MLRYEGRGLFCPSKPYAYHYQGVKEIQETWENLKFNVNRYIKGTSDRGFILGPTDEVATILDDNAMNLQSMSASRSVLCDRFHDTFMF